jgi:hypothetical protein
MGVCENPGKYWRAREDTNPNRTIGSPTAPYKEIKHLAVRNLNPSAISAML